MKNEMQDTSLESHREVLNNNVEGRRAQVYECIRKNQPCPNSVIARECRLPINCVTGRVKELRGYPFKCVGVAKKDMCPITSRLVIFWKTVRDIEVKKC